MRSSKIVESICQSDKENKTMERPFEEVEKAYLKRCGINSVADECKAEAEFFNKTLGEMEEKFPFLAYDDMYPEYGGRMRLHYVKGIGAWQDVANILIAHGYEVTLHTEVASEVEREVDGNDKWIVIEFGEVE